jgi:alkanesulfonate monooxygenase SsuD/methylene tetrahydromethanopterin reductase-like flavin-dependent oxidoreductase (luciferase family)
MRIDLSGFQRAGTHGDHREFLRLFERADAQGYDGVWLNELHFHRTELPYPAPLLLAAAIFARTERLRVGTSVLVLPLHHPLLLAEQVLQTDFQSGGRLDVGLGRGTASDDHFVALGVDLGTSRERFAEAFGILVDACTRPEVSADGAFWRFAGVAVGPPPVQRPHPPLYLAGYTRESIAFAVERGLPLLLSLEPPEERQLAICRALAAERGLPYVPYDTAGFSFTRYVCLAPTAAEADALVDDLLPRLNRRRLAFAAQRGKPAAGVELRTKAEFLREQCIAGDPQACSDQLTALAGRGVTELRLVFNGNGEVSPRQAREEMELFARELLPHCRAL